MTAISRDGLAARLAHAFLICLLGVSGLETHSWASEPRNVWSIEAGPIDPTRYFGETVANGMIGIVSTASPFRMEATLIAGAYDIQRSGGVASLQRTFHLLNLGLEIDGERVDRFDQVRNVRQTLDMKRAVLKTSFEYQGKASITYSTRALRHLPYCALLEVTIVARQPVTIAPVSSIEAAASLVGVTVYDKRVGGQRPDRSDANVIYVARAKSPSGRLDVAASHTFVFPGSADAIPSIAVMPSGLKFSRKLAAGETLHFGLVGSTVTSSHLSDPANASQRLTTSAALQGIAGLLEKHDRAWADLWKSDIRIEGDAAAQRNVRSMLYHLYSFAREDTAHSIAPMGLSSEGYGGRIFWDAEIWVFPVLLALQPRIARSMLEYRYQRLPAARKNAAAFGYDGAMFPWESADSGHEDTPVEVLTGVLEHHVSADVAIAAWNYYRVTQDKEWLRDRGYPLISETANFWLSRVTRNARGAHDILHVIGADEFAENVDNNAYTNAAARENLAAATAAAKILGLTPNPDWESVRATIPILRFENGVTREHATYNGETIKQADVALLAFPLQAITDPEAIRRDLEYYAGRIHAGGPAMTKSILAILYQRLGMPDKALTTFTDGFQPNLRPPFGVLAETAQKPNPYFATAAGGLLQTMLYGFAGLHITDEGIVQRPTKLPAQWKSVVITGVGAQQREYAAR